MENSSRKVRSSSLLPREHGAYVELLAPLLMALVFTPLTLAGTLFAVFACSVFLAHEPLLVLLGRRGQRTRERLQDRAQIRLMTLGATATVSLLGTFLLASRAVHQVLLASLLLAFVSLFVMARQLERTLVGQLLLASTLTSFAVPVLVAADLPTSRALLLAGLWMAIHALATLIARAFVYRKREGERLLGWATGASLMMMGLLAMISGQHVPLAFCLSPLPFVLITVVLALELYAPRTPRVLGFMLMTASIVSFALFGLGLQTQV